VLGFQHFDLAQRFRRSAKAAVNFSGMCCTMTMPGQTRGKRVNTASSACVPPVEVPMATMRRWSAPWR
jgi:hypothetical protein